MIDRERLKDRIKHYTESLKASEIPLFKGDYDWANHLRRSEIYFISFGKAQKVDFKNIDFTGPEIENQEWRAQLNRFFWLSTCMEEDAAGDEYFTGIAKDTVNAFLNFRDGVVLTDKKSVLDRLGDNVLNTSIRLGKRHDNGWWGTLPFMNNSIITDAFLEKAYDSTKEQIDFMIKYMAPHGNGRISQLTCLLFLGYIFENEEWLRFGTRGLNEAFRSQFDESGTHYEHNQGYHIWMTKEFTSIFQLACNIPELGLKIDSDKLIRAWEYSILSSCPDGKVVGLNDDKRWGYVNTEININNYHKAIEVHRSLIKDFTNRPYRDIKNDSRFYEEAGQWYVRNNKPNETQVLIFDATVFGGGHCHKAVNSISFYSGKRMLLTDPGTFNYEKKDPFRLYGKETRSHNTLNVDGLNQLWSSPVNQVSDIEGKCVFINNSYTNGYASEKSGATGIHERLVLWLKDKFCLINDFIVGSGREFTANFNFLPSDYSFNGSTFATGFGDKDIMIKPVYSNVPLKQNVYVESMDPMAGWLSKDGYKLRGAEKGCSMHVSGGIKNHGTIVSYIMMPFDNGVIPDADILNKDELIKDESEDEKNRIWDKPVKYSIRAGSGVYDIITGYGRYRESRQQMPIGRFAKYESDGKLTMVEFKDGKPVFAYLYDGSYLMYKGSMLIDETEAGNYERYLL